MTGRAGFQAGLEKPGERVTGASETGRGRPARTGPPALPASLLCPLQHEGLVPDQTWPRSCTPRPSTGNRAHGSQRPVFPQGAPWTPRMCPWARSGGPQGAMPWAGRLETCWVGEERGVGVGLCRIGAGWGPGGQPAQEAGSAGAISRSSQARFKLWTQERLPAADS